MAKVQAQFFLSIDPQFHTSAKERLIPAAVERLRPRGTRRRRRAAQAVAAPRAAAAPRKGRRFAERHLIAQQTGDDSSRGGAGWGQNLTAPLPSYRPLTARPAWAAMGHAPQAQAGQQA